MNRNVRCLQEVAELQQCLEEQQGLNQSQQGELTEARLRQLEAADLSAMLADLQRDNDHLTRLVGETDDRGKVSATGGRQGDGTVANI